VPLSWNLGTFTSWDALGHSRPVTALLCLFTYSFIVTFKFGIYTHIPYRYIGIFAHPV